jgi:hypothetical protein
MQQQMAGLVHHQATGPSPRLRAAHGMLSFSSGGAHGHHRVVLHTGRARLGRVTAAAARPKYSRLRGDAAIAAPETKTSRELLDQHFRPSHTAPSQQLTTGTVRFAIFIRWIPPWLLACMVSTFQLEATMHACPWPVPSLVTE